MNSLDDIESALWSMLSTFRPPLVDSTIYGMPSLTWPGVTGHGYFAAVKRAAKHVSVFLFIVEAYPETLEAASPDLLKRRTGKATFRFSTLDAALAADFEALLGRLFEAYQADHLTDLGSDS